MLSFSDHCFGCNKCSQLLLILLNCCSCKVTGWFSVRARWDLEQHVSSRADVSSWVVSSHMHPTFPGSRLSQGLPYLWRLGAHSASLTSGNEVNRKVRGSRRRQRRKIFFFLVLSIMWKKKRGLGARIPGSYLQLCPSLPWWPESVWVPVSSSVTRQAGQSFWGCCAQVGIQFSRLWPEDCPTQQRWRV